MIDVLEKKYVNQNTQGNNKMPKFFDSLVQ